MRVALFGQFYPNDTKPIIADLVQALLSQHLEVVIESDFQNTLQAEGLLSQAFATYADHHSLQALRPDLLISIGGDGTMLKAVTFVRDSGIPMVGINAGRLGFLAKVQREHLDDFVEVLKQGRFHLSSRALLQVQAQGIHVDWDDFPYALNEIAVSRKDTTSMITIDTRLDAHHLTAYWADGLIMATPTGSTGYSLSCGGPILMPEVESMVLTPIAPHNLNARPLVISDQTLVQLTVTGRESHFLVALDARVFVVPNDTQLLLQKATFGLTLIEFDEEPFVKTLRNKLLWGEDKRN